MIAIVLLAMGATLAALVWSPYLGWLVAFVAKPIVDIGWSAEYTVLGLTPLEIVGAGLPAILLARMVITRGPNRTKLPLLGPWLAYVATLVIGASMFAMSGDYVGALSFLLRTLNGVIAFYSIAVWFADRDRFRTLIIALLIAGLVPMVMGFYESVTGNYWRLRYGAGDQIRITGLYHNSTNLRYYAYATLTAIALYWVYFAPRSRTMKLLLLAYTAVCGVVLFKVYSKAGFVTVAFAAVAWVIIGRNYLWPVLLVLAALVANVAFDDIVTREIGATFEKDIGAVQGTQSADRAFGGRMGMWRGQWQQFTDQDVLSQLFGSGEEGGGRGARGGGHNDYMRVLQQTGIVGLLAYVTLLATVGFALVRRVLYERTPLVLVAFVIYVAWLVETIGFTPGIFTGYQWYSWGFIALALVGIRGLDRTEPVPRGPATRLIRFPNFIDLQPTSCNVSPRS